MDYGRILSRAWDIIWEHKFLILLGVLVALTSGGNAASSGSGFQFDGFNGEAQPPQDFRDLPQIPNLPDLRDGRGLPIATVILGILLALLAIIIGLVFWVISTIARGGLIAGVNTLADGGTSSFGQAFSAGWAKVWRLLGISILPAIPTLLLLIAGVGAVGLFGGLARVIGGNWRLNPLGPGLGVLVTAIICILVPISLALSLLAAFAYRACMIEDLGVIDAYARGWQVLTANLGAAFVLFIIQIGIGIALGLLLLIPSAIMALCCILWPVLLVVRGAIEAYYSTMWTLAWREWTLKPI